jgi:hypothetical protein
MAQNWTKQIGTIATALAVVFALWMIATTGIGEAANIVISPEDVSAATNLSFGGVGGVVDYLDRVAVAGAFVTILGAGGFAVVTRSKDNPPFVNTLLQWTPVIIGFIAFSAFNAEIMALLQGDRVWASFDDVQNSFMGYLAFSMVAGIAALLENRNKKA